jgi:hypothetical protein
LLGTKGYVVVVVVMNHLQQSMASFTEQIQQSTKSTDYQSTNSTIKALTPPTQLTWLVMLNYLFHH